MDERTTATNDPGTERDLKRDSHDEVLSAVISSGLVSIVIGSLVGSFIFQLFGLFGENDWNIQMALATFAPVAAGFGTGGLVIVLGLSLTVVLPIHLFFKRVVPRNIMTVVSAIAGAFIASLPWLIRLLYGFFADTKTYYSENANDRLWVVPLTWCTTGLMFGGLFGFVYGQWNKAEVKPGPMEADRSEKGKPKNKAPRLNKTNLVLAGVLLVFVILLIWTFSTPFRMIWSARRAAVANQEGIIAEATQMLQETERSENGFVVYGESDNKPLPENFAKLEAQSASTSHRFPGAVKVAVTSGFTHLGLFIVPEPTSATIPMLRDNVVTEDHGSLTVVNDHIFKYSEGS